MRLSPADAVYQIACFVILVFAFVTVFFPLAFCVASSLSSAEQINAGRVFLWPRGFSLNAYKSAFEYPLLMTGFLNSCFYVFFGTIVSVTLILLAAYPLSRKDLFLRKFFLYFFVITMFFSGGLVPNYLLVRDLNLMGSRGSQVLAFMFSCYNMIIVKSYFQSSLPQSLLDAAHIDGCGDVRFFFIIALPLSVPVIAVMILYNAVGIWNSYFKGLMYLLRLDTYNFQMILQQILFVANLPPEIMESMNPERVRQIYDIMQEIRYTVLVIGALPMMVLYPFIQKYFIRGIMIGSLKE
ncbi:MAG: carbohydrate ABC transporter permease [Treponema sp.]|jgi:multiple sugar transport system permease protein/putative aldouronate transport system permease protein|nr:carbohydrate ABC transporter permease [Treponema sp.]